LDAIGRFLGAAQRRQQHAGQDRDNRNHHQQLDKRERQSGVPPARSERQGSSRLALVLQFCVNELVHHLSYLWFLPASNFTDLIRYRTGSTTFAKLFRHSARIFSGFAASSTYVYDEEKLDIAHRSGSARRPVALPE